MTRDAIRATLTAEQAVTATLYGEARGEPLDGIVAVACVIRNRATNPAWWGTDYRSVCLAKAQFSCWWEDNANSAETYQVAESLINGGPVGERTVLSEIRWVAAGILGDRLRDVTRSADHYLTATLYRQKESPSWAKQRVPVARVASSVFFRLEI